MLARFKNLEGNKYINDKVEIKVDKAQNTAIGILKHKIQEENASTQLVSNETRTIT